MKRLWWALLGVAKAGAAAGYQLHTPVDSTARKQAYEPSGPRGTSQQAVLDPSSSSDSTTGTPISPALFTLLEKSSRITDIAYCVGPPFDISPPFTCPSRCADFPTFQLITTFSPSSPLPLVDEPATGYLAYDHDPQFPRLILAFRGTYSLADAIADLGTIPQPYKPYPFDEPGSPSRSASRRSNPPAATARCENCTVHSGFYASYLATRNLLLPLISDAYDAHPHYQLTISGHSLGGSIALLSALELHARGLAPTLTMFGAPKVGNEAFARHVAQQLGGEVEEVLDGDSFSVPRMRRVTHKGDPVPGLPWDEWGYVQPEGEIYINKQTLPVGRENVVICKTGCHRQSSPDDADDVTAVKYERALMKRAWPVAMPWTLVAAHRDYLHRLGLCVA